MACDAEYMESLDTPSLVVDLDKAEFNLREMSELCADAGVALRPHIKTHKSPFFALQQMQLGACGVTAAKLGEAEVMADAGISDICVAYPLVGWRKLTRLTELMKRARVSLPLDSHEVASGLSELGRSLGVRIPVLLEIDSGLGRLGVPPGAAALPAAEMIARFENLHLMGIFTHEGHTLKSASRAELAERSVEIGQVMVGTADLLRSHGFDIQVVSVGSTQSARDIMRVPGITEVRPGTYVFYDRNMMSVGVVPEERCALTVLTTVVARPDSTRAIIDAGSKTLSTDLCARSDWVGYGRVKGRSEIVIDRLMEEHGMLRLPAGGSDIEVGDRIEVIPNHVCPSVNLADTLYGVRNGRFEREIPVVARGKNQ
jgi:D-serine deaminase-like pyridoxal phosphate-dependent protein